MRDILKLLRVRHYIKNFIVFIPLFFAGKILDLNRITEGLFGFVSFCLVSSAIYIFNDIKDVENDRKHPTKKNRPIASGKVSKQHAKCVIYICILIAILILIYRREWLGMIVLGVFLFVNILYSCGLKNVPIVDIVILASGFVFRIIYGGVITDIEISNWLYLVVATGALFLGLGKRRNEIKMQHDTRKVLIYYNKAFLNNNMYVCLSLTIMFYAMWCLECLESVGIWTVPMLIIILMKYSLDIEGDSDGDPIEVISHDKILILLVIIYGLSFFTLLYLV